jgi:hypothetical protein
LPALVEPLPIAPAFIRTPSMMKIGALLSDNELSPRTRITGGDPVLFPGSTVMPGDLATSRSLMLLTEVCSTRLFTSPRVATVFPSSTRRCMPVAVVTTS